MGKLYDAIDDRLAAWIEGQRMFFVATVPSGADGHVGDRVLVEDAQRLDRPL